MKAQIDFPLQSAEWPSVVIDGSGFIHAFNRAAVSLFGVAVEASEARLSALWSPQNAETFDHFMRGPTPAPGAGASHKFKSQGGVTVSLRCFLCPLDQDGEKHFLLQMFREPATPAEKPAVNGKEPGVEAAVAHKQKLDCALQLIRTVALDFNNALTSILGHTSLLLAQMPSGNPWRSSLAEVEKSAEKAAEIANDLASFSRTEKDVRGNQPGNLNQVLRRTVELYQAPGSPPVTWTLQLENRLYTANFDEAKMQQAFMKILDNAIQSPGRDRSITVATSNRSLSDSMRVGTVALAAGHYVYLEISDNGGGIAPDVLPRAFEPFFTTKPGHRGLGLAWVYGIITNHGGHVTIFNRESVGTSVGIYLPAKKKIVRDSEIHDDNLSGTQTILMVDDEELLLTMGQMILSAYGYRVLTASSGEKALEVFANSGSKIDLVITDLVMPRMSGRELSEQLRQSSSLVRIICTSGYVRPSQVDDDDAYLQKPFTSQDLLRRVKSALST